MICELRIHQLRNLRQASLSLARCNLIVGKNGSGKTSLLEAVFLLSRGKSFRHHEPKRFISHHQKQCVVWAKTKSTATHTLAIKKQLDLAGKSDTILKLNDNNVPAQSVLSRHLSTMLIDPSGMSMLDEGSAVRRQMLDWLAFHVKPDFHQAWLAYQRLLKQRNSLLKQPNIRGQKHQLTAWDSQLAYYADLLHSYRLEVFEWWQVCFDQMVAKLLPTYQGLLNLHYQAGFDTKIPLQEILRTRIEQDIELGYTRIGAHRADVLVLLKSDNDEQKLKEQATHILSRGEKKLLITALKISQLQLICHLLADNPDIPTPVVLIDDIDAELDWWAVQIFLQVVLSLPCQTIITSLNTKIHHLIQENLKPANDATIYQLFHAKQGCFFPVDEIKSLVLE